MKNSRPVQSKIITTVFAIAALLLQPIVALNVPAAFAAPTNVHTADPSMPGWNLSETRTKGHNELVDGGLRVWTETNDSESKAAGYYPASFNLAQAGSPSMELSNSTGVKPSIQLATDFDNDGTFDGYLVGETVYGSNWWYSGWRQSVKDNAPVNGTGNGSEWFGTLDQWSTSFSNAQVVAIGYSLGSGVQGDSVINKIRVGGTKYTFDKPAPSPQITSVDPYLVKSSYKGVSVDFKTKDITTAKTVEVRIHRDNADDFVRTGKANVINLVNAGSGVTAPFAIQEVITDTGTGSWNAPAGAPWTSATIPTGASVTITLEDGTVVGPVSKSPISTNLATLAEVMPQDKQGPSISVETAADNDIIGGTTQLIRVKATDPSGVKDDSVYVRFKNAAGNEFTYYLVRESAGSDYFSNEINTTQFVPKGQLLTLSSVSYRAADTKGNPRSTKRNNVTVDNKNPSITNAKLSKTVVGPNSNSVLSADVDGTGSNVASAQYRIHTSGGAEVNGYSWVDMSASAAPFDQKNESIEKVLNVSGLAEGNYVARVRAFDALGNKKSGIDVAFTVDKTAPAVASAIFTEDNDGDSVSNGGTTDSQFFTFNLGNSATDINHYELKYWNDIPTSQIKQNKPWNKKNIPASGVYKDNFTQGEGKHYFSFIACDDAGNCSTEPLVFAITYDKTVQIPMTPIGPSTPGGTGSDEGPGGDLATGQENEDVDTGNTTPIANPASLPIFPQGFLQSNFATTGPSASGDILAAESNKQVEARQNVLKNADNLAAVAGDQTKAGFWEQLLNWWWVPAAILAVSILLWLIAAARRNKEEI